MTDAWCYYDMKDHAGMEAGLLVASPTVAVCHDDWIHEQEWNSVVVVTAGISTAKIHQLTAGAQATCWHQHSHVKEIECHLYTKVTNQS